MTQNRPISPWMSFADPVQASVQYMLQWLSMVYPDCAERLPEATKRAASLYDPSLTHHWSDLLDHEPVATHLNVLDWAAKQFTQDQKPYVIEACWYLVLGRYRLPSTLPSPFQILARALELDPAQLLAQGQRMGQAMEQDGTAGQQMIDQQHSDYLTQLKLSLIPQATPEKTPWDWQDLVRLWPIGLATLVALSLFTVTLWPTQTEQTTTPAATMQAPALTTNSVSDVQTVPDIKSAVPDDHYLVTANLLNLREQPRAGSTILLVLPMDTIVSVVSVTEDGEWAQVSVAEQIGYVSRQYLKKRQ